MENLEELLSLLFKQKQQSPYFSVLDDPSMENPRYRSYLEQKQGLDNVYPELWLAGRGSSVPRASLGSRATIGANVPKNYVPFTELPQSEQRLAMLKQAGRTRQEPPVDPLFLKLFMDMAQDRAKGTIGSFVLEDLLRQK